MQAAVDQGVAAFGGIDVCINNASAISLTGTLATDMKRYDLMNQVNARGTFLCSKLTLPHLLKASQRSRRPRAHARALAGSSAIVGQRLRIGAMTARRCAAPAGDASLGRRGARSSFSARSSARRSPIGSRGRAATGW